MMRHPERGPGSSAAEARLFEQLRARASRVLGARHWTNALAGFAWLQRGLAVLERDPVVVYSDEAFRGVSREVASWLAANAANNSEQRLSALFATVRLEHNLGGGLAAWGYEPADPLGGGLEAVTRLREHGWLISEKGCTRVPSKAAEPPPSRRAAAQPPPSAASSVYSSGAPALSEGPGLPAVRGGAPRLQAPPRRLGLWQH